MLVQVKGPWQLLSSSPMTSAWAEGPLAPMPGVLLAAGVVRATTGAAAGAAGGMSVRVGPKVA